jgi:CheY-like chemotaxis protein
MEKRILVVARASDVVETIPITLELAGHKVTLADCGLDAILWSERFLPDLILVDASLPDMDGSTIIGILQCLPSTAALATLLLKPRGHNPSAQSQPGRPENGALHSSELLRQVAFALTLCHAAHQPASPPRQKEALYAR